MITTVAIKRKFFFSAVTSLVDSVLGAFDSAITQLKILFMKIKFDPLYRGIQVFAFLVAVSYIVLEDPPPLKQNACLSLDMARN